MSLALPPVALPHAPTPSRPLKGLALVLAVVLGLHWWLLGDLPLQLPWSEADAPQENATVAMQTRVLLAPEVAAPVAAPATPAPKPRKPPTPVRPPAAAPPPIAGAAQATSVPFVPPAPVDIALPAPEFIAEPAPTPPAPTPPPPAPQERPLRYAFPPPVRLNYDVSALTGGNRNIAGAQITWKHDGANYQASLMVTKFLINMRQWTSKGALAETGLAPLRFGDKGRGSEVAAHFVRDEGKVIFSANTPEAPLPFGKAAFPRGIFAPICRGMKGVSDI